MSKKTALNIIPKHRIVYCNENQKVVKLFDIFLNNYRRIPVVSSGKLKGIVCITDLLDFLGAGEKYHQFARVKNLLNVSVKKIMTGNPYTIKADTELEEVLNFFKERERGAYPVISRGSIKGMITEWDILKLYRGSDLKVKDIMTEKPFTTKKEDSVFSVSKMMVRGGFRRLPVIENGFLVGIITPSDILYHLYSKNKALSLRKDKVPIKQIMRKGVLTTRPDTRIDSVVKLMLERKIGGMPVTEDMELLGIITERDIVNSIKI